MERITESVFMVDYVLPLCATSAGKLCAIITECTRVANFVLRSPRVINKYVVMRRARELSRFRQSHGYELRNEETGNSYNIVKTRRSLL